MKLNRILRNEEGASPGGGAVPPAPVTEPQAQAEAPVTMSALKELLGTLKTEIVTEAKNGVNADLRRAGVFKNGKDDKPPPASPAAAAVPASTGLSAADVQAMLKRDRVITTRTVKHELDPAKTRWLETALQGVEPERLDEVADSFLNELGLVKATPAPTNPAPTIHPGPAAPTSDKGSPAPGGVLDWEREYAENPIGMSPAARQRMDAKYGAEKARQMRLEAARAQADRIKVTKPQGN